MPAGGDLSELAAPVQARLAERHDARERAFVLSRRAIRSSANAIRAEHRGDGDLADDLLEQADAALDEARTALAPHPAVLWSGFLQDAAKEYAEAAVTRAALRDRDIPSADDLGVDDASWLHGLAETVGELRRACLDHVRHGELDEGERLLDLMQEILSVLAAVDVPDALTRGLRRATDGARAITERTRGDLTTAVGQRELRLALDAHRGALEQVLGRDG